MGPTSIYNLERRIDGLEYRVSTVEKSHAEIMAVLLPLSKALDRLKFTIAGLGFLGGLAVAAAKAISLYHH